MTPLHRIYLRIIRCLFPGLTNIKNISKYYTSYTSTKDVEHIIINESKKEYVKKGIYHLNNINNYHSRLKKWISRFNGVSTKYLQLYLVWFQFLDNRN